MVSENVVGVTSAVFMSARMALSSVMPNSKNYQKTTKAPCSVLQRAFHFEKQSSQMIIDKDTKASYSKLNFRIGVGSFPGSSKKRRDNKGSL